MKQINTLLDDTVTEKNDLSTNFYALKDTVDHVISSAEGGYNVYAKNVVTTDVNVDGTMSVQEFQIKGSEFSPVDADGNRVPARFQNVFIGSNTDVLNSIQNLTQKTNTIQQSLSDIGVDTKIRNESAGLTIEGASGTFNNITSKNYNVIDDENNVVGFMTTNESGDFVFYKSGTQGERIQASVVCASINFTTGGSMYGEVDEDGV
jgi:hypothetical protein